MVCLYTGVRAPIYRYFDRCGVCGVKRHSAAGLQKNRVIVHCVPCLCCRCIVSTNGSAFAVLCASDPAPCNLAYDRGARLWAAGLPHVQTARGPVGGCLPGPARHRARPRSLCHVQSVARVGPEAAVAMLHEGCRCSWPRAESRVAHPAECRQGPSTARFGQMHRRPARHRLWVARGRPRRWYVRPDVAARHCASAKRRWVVNGLDHDQRNSRWSPGDRARRASIGG
jgi:hypothetical protein